MNFRKNTLKIITSFFVLTLIFSSCASHQRSNIKSKEKFVVELIKPTTRSRGSLVDTAIEGLFVGAKYLVDNSTKKLVNSYKNSISINDYYNNISGKIVKSYSGFQLKKYGNPVEVRDRTTMKSIITKEIDVAPKSRGAKSLLAIDDIFPKKNDDLLNFHAVISFESDEDNPGVTRLSFDELRVFFSKTKVFKDENLNARVLISIEGQWRSTDGEPKTATLIEQEYNFKNIKYGYKNQINKPILTKWYYDIPILPELEENTTYGVVKINIQLEEYEGKKSKYLNKLPSILSDNKNTIITSGSSTINKILK